MSSALNKIRKSFLLIGAAIILIVTGIFAVSRSIGEKRPAGVNPGLETSIAVLPFVNDSPDTGTEYFCNGMMEDILNNLAKINKLNVKSRTDAEAYRGVKRSRREIAREPGVSYLLEGSVRKQGNSFKMTVHLIDAATGFRKWSRPYEGEFSDVFSVQADVAKKVADELELVLSSEESEEIDKLPTVSLKAYEYFILAQQESKSFWNSHNPEDFGKTFEYLLKAQEIGPIIGVNTISYVWLGTLPFYKDFHNDVVFKEIVKRQEEEAARSRAEVNGMVLRGEFDL